MSTDRVENENLLDVGKDDLLRFVVQRVLDRFEKYANDELQTLNVALLGCDELVDGFLSLSFLVWQVCERIWIDQTGPSL